MNAAPYRVLSFGPRAPVPIAAAPTPVARQPLGYAGGDYAQGLARALDAMQGNPPRSAPALGEDLLAQALLQHARNNFAPGQADPATLAGAGGGGYGAGPMSNIGNFKVPSPGGFSGA